MRIISLASILGLSFLLASSLAWAAPLGISGTWHVSQSSAPIVIDEKGGAMVVDGESTPYQVLDSGEGWIKVVLGDQKDQPVTITKKSEGVLLMESDDGEARPAIMKGAKLARPEDPVSGVWHGSEQGESILLDLDKPEAVVGGDEESETYELKELDAKKHIYELEGLTAIAVRPLTDEYALLCEVTEDEAGKRVVKAIEEGGQCALLTRPAVDVSEQSDPPEENVGGVDLFTIGMSKEDAKLNGAKAAKDPSVMTMKDKWLDADWETVLTFDKGDGLATVAMVTALDHRTLAGLAENMAGKDYKLLSISGDQKDDNVALYILAAEGASPEKLEEASQEAISRFADREKGAMTLIYCPAAMFDDFAKVVKDKGDEDAIAAKHNEDELFAIQMDKSNDRMTLINSKASTLGAM